MSSASVSWLPIRSNAAMAMPPWPRVKLPILLSGEFISLWPNVIQGTAVYSATAYGARVADCGLRHSRPYAAHVPHNVALVDLADYLLAHTPDAEWRTEREVDRVLREASGSKPGAASCVAKARTPARTACC